MIIDEKILKISESLDANKRHDMKVQYFNKNAKMQLHIHNGTVLEKFLKFGTCLVIGNFEKHCSSS